MAVRFGNESMPEARKIHEQTAAKEAVDKRRLLVLLDLSAKPEQAGDDLAHIRSVIPQARIVVLIDASRSQILTTCLGARATADLRGPSPTMGQRAPNFR